MKTLSLLIIEDEVAIREMIKFALSSHDFTVIEASDAKEATIHISNHIPDLILLDWMLPGISGIDFAKDLKRNAVTRNIPIIIITARAEEENKIKGLETGADDYITKPFSTRELIARIRSVLRRGPLVTPEGMIHFNALCLNTATHQVEINHCSIFLSPIEYKLLYFFMTHQSRVYNRSQLLDHVWGGNHYIDERTVDVHIRRLRTRLKPHGYDQHIKTVRGAGYQFT